MSFDFETNYLWGGLVAASGSAGNRWLVSYSQEQRAISDALRSSRACSRNGRMGESLSLLDNSWERLQELTSTRASIAYVLGRFYFGSLAFYYFCGNEHDAAYEALSEAHVAIRKAVQAESFLLPFAALATDIPLKKAQVERARRRWPAMAAQAAMLRAMLTDQQPLCVLDDGRAISHRAIGESLARLPGLGEELAPALGYLLNDSLRADILERQVEGLYALPGLLIPVP